MSSALVPSPRGSIAAELAKAVEMREPISSSLSPPGPSASTDAGVFADGGHPDASSSDAATVTSMPPLPASFAVMKRNTGLPMPPGKGKSKGKANNKGRVQAIDRAAVSKGPGMVSKGPGMVSKVPGKRMASSKAKSGNKGSVGKDTLARCPACGHHIKLSISSISDIVHDDDVQVCASVKL